MQLTETMNERPCGRRRYCGRALRHAVRTLVIELSMNEGMHVV